VKRHAVAALLFVAVAAALAAQASPVPAFEVQQSSGFVEALLPDLGWRQAVIGRQLPAGSVITSWIDAAATLAFADTVLTLEPMSHLGVAAVGSDLVRLSMASGGVKVQTAAVVVELEVRGFVIHIENATAVLSDGTLRVEAGTVVVNGAQNGPMPVAAGSSIQLLASPEGPVFPVSDP
jgi:hypothetical protein